ncbi:MAG: hypothetical protein ACR2N2_10230, partial [Acidimicrobiia bacterium]
MGASWTSAALGVGAALLCIAAVVTVVLVWRSPHPRLVKSGQSLIVGSTLLAVLALAGYMADDELSSAFSDWTVTNAFAAAWIGAVAFLALPRTPRNLAVWTLVGAAFFSALQAVGSYLATTGGVTNAAVQDGTVDLAPADLPIGAAIGVNLALWTWIPALFLMVTFGLLLFPSGRLRTPRWRWVAGAAAVGIVVPSVAVAWLVRPRRTVPYSEIIGSWDGMLGIPLLVLLVSSALSIISVLLTWRKSSGDERLQFRWAGSALLLFAISSVILFQISTDALQAFSTFVALPLLFVAYGIAITKYRLYDIDIVVSRALVYGVLGAFITVTYVAIVAGPLLLLGRGGGGVDEAPPPILAIGATALIALLFQPVRRWLQRLADRLVYGKRATPYEVLSDFSRRVAATDEELLEQVPESLVDGTGAEAAALWVRNGAAWTRTTTFPLGVVPVPFPGFSESVDGLVCVPVEHD